MNDSGGFLAGVGLVLGPLAALALLLLADLEPGKPEVTATAAVAVLMAVWWLTEALPLAVTSLVPVVLFPVLGVMNGKAVATQYFNHVIFLFLGGFMVALAMERWNLHRRIALRVLLVFGNRPRGMLMGFMVATAFLSMWISNTAATMMMATIVLALILRLEGSASPREVRRFSIGLLLAVAYSASIGGLATLVGTPPNMVFARLFEIQFPAAPPISFTTWLTFALPVSVAFLVATWLFLALVYAPRHSALAIDPEVIGRQYRELGPLSFAERVVLVDFVGLVLLWLTRGDLQIGATTLPGWARLLSHASYINDGTVAIAMAAILFVVPARQGPGSRIMDWPTAERLPWNIVLLFGGGFALASGFVEGGLSAWLGQQLQAAATLSPFLLIAVACLTITFVTELTSNTATAQMVLPILAVQAAAIGLNPLFLMVPVTLSCSCAFMMPVATPPNAIVFGSGRLRIADMARTGLVLNFAGAMLILAAMYLLGGAVWGIDLGHLPAWAAVKR